MGSRAVSPLEAHLGYWLRFVSNHVSHAFAGKLAACGVTVAEWAVMRQMFESAATAPSDVAARMGMTRGAITKLVDRLAEKGLLTRAPGRGDRRYQVLRLTAEGRGLVPKLAALADSNDAEFFGHMKPAERNRLADAMKDIVRRRGLKAIPTE
jgi:DNA-binding MarR family transcriptional regulator